MAGNVGRRRKLLAARARGLSLARAAEEAGMSTREAERLNADPVFQAELQERLTDLDTEDQRALVQHRREVLRANRYALAAHLLLLYERSPAVRDRAARAIEDHLARLLPQAVDLAVVDASPAEVPRQRRTLRDVFELHEDAHDAEVVDLARWVYRGLVARSEADAAPVEQRPAVQREPASEPPAYPKEVKDLDRWLRHAADEPAEEAPTPRRDPVVLLRVLPGNVQARFDELNRKPVLSLDEEREFGEILAQHSAAVRR